MFGSRKHEEERWTTFAPQTEEQLQTWYEKARADFGDDYAQEMVDLQIRHEKEREELHNKYSRVLYDIETDRAMYFKGLPQIALVDARIDVQAYQAWYKRTFGGVVPDVVEAVKLTGEVLTRHDKTLSYKVVWGKGNLIYIPAQFVTIHEST